MAKTLAAVSQPRPETANQNYKIENCPIKRSSSSLDAWVDEVLLWDESNAALSDSIRAKKYLKLVDSVRKSENCKDIQNLVKVEFVENHEFDKKGVDVIKTIVNKIKEKLGKSDIEKCSSAWIDFINIKQGTDEAASAFVSRFEKVESQLRNVKIVIPNKALAIHMMNKSNMEQQSKENVLTKTKLDDESEIYSSMKKSIREMKGNLTTEKAPKAVTENNTFYEAGAGYPSRRSRSKSRFNNRDRNRSGSRRDGEFSRGGRSSSRRGYRDYNKSSGDGNNGDYKSSRSRERGGRERYRGSNWQESRHEQNRGRSESRHSTRGNDAEVREVYLSEYKDNYKSNHEVIKDIVKGYHGIDKDIIETIYTEGNVDIDPYVGIVDSGCPKTVAGKPWMDAFIESKGISVARNREDEYFRFGPSKTYKSEENFEIEVEIGNFKDTMKVSVVDTNIPLLIGLDYQKRWGMVLDVSENTIHMKISNQTFKIKKKNHHWMFPIQRKNILQQVKHIVFSVNLDNLGEDKLRKHIVRVHKNLAHKSEDQLLKLFKLAGKDTKLVKKVVKNVVETCNICKRYKKTPPRPKVAMPKAYSTNEVVSMDLKERRDYKKEILYICDEFSGFLVAEVLPNKDPENVIKAFNKRWVNEGPGVPSKGLFADNGGEFKNAKMKELAAKYGITLKLTAAHSPWSNGKNERNHYTCDIIIDKLLEEDPKMTLEEAVTLAVNAKNLQINKTGFSPRQLTFGKQGTIPGITDGNPASMETITESDSFRREFVNRQYAEELYRKVDSNARLQKCLIQRTYGYADNKYSEGDAVLFKENDVGRWSGPAKVTGMEGTKVRIIHAGFDRTVPTCRVMPHDDEKEIVDENDVGEELIVEVSEDKSIIEDDASIPETNREMRPKMRRKILYKLPGDKNWRSGRVTRVGKNTGLDKFRCWVTSGDKELNFDFIKDVITWKYCDVSFSEETKAKDDESRVTTEILYTGVLSMKTQDMKNIEVPQDVFVTNIPEKYHNEPDVLKAKHDELEKWDNYGAFEEVELDGQHVLGSRWVVQDRHGKVKARFVVKGCQEKSEPRSDSPTASKDSLKLFLTIAANEEFGLKTLDVTSAFLQGYPLDRDVFIKPPVERFKEGIVWKLKKSCYGLYDASRKWYLAVKETMTSMGMKNLSGDEAFFYILKDGKLIGMCLIHVDDFLVAGNDIFFKLVQDKLEKRFTFGKIECRSFKFTGLNIRETKDGIMVDQNEYIQSLQPIKIDKLNDKDEKLPKNKFKEYRALTGQLSWAAELTRPDISFDARELSTKNKDATYEDLKHANKVLKKAQLERDVTLKFSKLGNMKDLKIIAYTDSSYRNSEDKEKSVGGRLVVLANKDGESNPIIWKSKTIQQVCKSVKSAETRSLERGMEDAIYLARMVEEVHTGIVSENQIPVEMKFYSKTLHDTG